MDKPERHAQSIPPVALCGSPVATAMDTKVRVPLTWQCSKGTFPPEFLHNKTGPESSWGRDMWPPHSITHSMNNDLSPTAGGLLRACGWERRETERNALNDFLTRLHVQ